MTITGKQIAMARILLDLSQQDLADALGITRKTVLRLESGQSPGSASTMETIKIFFEKNNIEFKGEHGINKVSNRIRTLTGPEGLKSFLDDMYTTLREKGGHVFIYNAKPEYWIKWLGHEWFQAHSDRMSKIKNKVDYRIISENDNYYFISAHFAEYRWIPKDFFTDQPIYTYEDKLAFINFEEDTVSVNVLQNEQFAKGFAGLFKIAWNKVAIKPDVHKAPPDIKKAAD